MSYYILPKNNNNIDINPILESSCLTSYISHSLYNYYRESKNQLNDFIQTNETICVFENLLKSINPYEYIFSNVPGSKYPVSKLKSKTNLFYDLLEIFIILNIYDFFLNKNIESIHISENYSDSNQCINFLRENQINEHTNFENITEEIYNTINNKRYNFIFYEIKNTDFDNLNNYILNTIQALMVLLKYQSNNGVCIIKINHIFHKPIIDILYILCSNYEKVYIIKPNTTNITSFDKYIVCKNFILNNDKKDFYKNYYFKLAQFISVYIQSNNVTKNIVSIISCKIPSYFINKIDDLNIIVGQQQLESICQIINILKNKIKEDKITILKKTNIQKCVIWCEKFKIPHNKFSEKVNIFLPLKIENEENENENENEENIII